MICHNPCTLDQYVFMKGLTLLDALNNKTYSISCHVDMLDELPANSLVLFMNRYTSTKSERQHITPLCISRKYKYVSTFFCKYVDNL